MLYSVPYEYIKKKVDVRVTEHTIEISTTITALLPTAAKYRAPGLYSTITEHMPQDHQRYLEWNGGRFRKWANIYPYIPRM